MAKTTTILLHIPSMGQEFGHGTVGWYISALVYMKTERGRLKWLGMTLMTRR